MKLKGQQQISVHLPAALHERLRLLSYELHKSQTKIVVDALVLYDEVVKRNRAATKPAEKEEESP